MPNIVVDTLTFHFHDEWQVTKFDEWDFYRSDFQKICGGAKATDLVALDTTRCAWLVESKDYRVHRRTKTIDLADEVAMKVRDTLAGLFTAHVVSSDGGEKKLAKAVFNAGRLRVVLHLEQPAKHSKMFPRAIDPALVKQKLKQRLKCVDSHPVVVEKARMGSLGWTVT